MIPAAEAAVRSLLCDVTDELRVPDGIASAAWRRGRRRRRLYTVSAAFSVVAAVSVGAAAATLASHTGSHPLGSAIVAVPASVPAQAAQATRAPCQAARSNLAATDPALAAICLTLPVGRFGFSAEPSGDLSYIDADEGRGPRLTRTFAIAQTPSVSSTVHGLQEVDATGPEVVVMIARHGAFATSPSDVHSLGLLTVAGTTVVRGVTATVALDSDNQRHLLATIDGFDLEVTGSNPPDRSAPPSVAALVDVVDNLTGL